MIYEREFGIRMRHPFHILPYRYSSSGDHRNDRLTSGFHRVESVKIAYECFHLLGYELQHMALTIFKREDVETHFHQIVAGIAFAVFVQ